MSGAKLNLVSESDGENLADLKGQVSAISRSQAVIEFNLDGTIIRANENFCNAMGYSFDEIQGKHHSMFADPDYAASSEYKEFWAKLNRGEFAAGAYKRLGKNGKLVWIQASYNPILDDSGKPFKVIKFASDITEMKRLADIAQMVELAPTNTMFADKLGNLKLLNAKSVETLKTLEKHLPKPVDQLVGNSIDIFHKNPEHQRRIIANAGNLPLKAMIEIGGEKLDLLISPVMNSEGEYLGPMVTWEVVTQKLKNENELARIWSMMENVPVNVMCADKDGNILYLNPKSTETLKTLEKHLPIPVEKIVGSSFDVFHKNPPHQRNLVATDRQLPIKSIIDVAGEKLDLLVSGMYDKDKNYIGPMVTWEVVTEKLKSENELARIWSMMENVPANVMCADAEGNIQYLNPSSRETLKSLEKHLPIAVDKITGASFDVFHKNPAHQRNLVKDDRNFPIKSIIDVAGEKLDLLVNGMYDKDQKYIGPMVTWSVVTEKLKQEKELAQIFSMVENAPVNIMFADLEFTISFLNPKSRETLRSIEKLLPIPVDKIVGSKFDVFHKNPEHQRKIISDDRNLPMKSKIKVGEETLDLLVSAIYDHNKTYIGAMVTWEVISDKVALVNSLEETSNKLAAAANELTATATQMANNSSKTTEQSGSAASSAEEVASGVQNVATNTEEMLSSVKEISRSANESAEQSKQTMVKAQDTNTTIKDLGESSQEIGNVIKVISSIAQQTNLLALNATIEAARAGDAGKGFAVVANEVKELAKQTAKATEDITGKIGNIQDSSKGAVEAIAGITDAIQKMNEIAGTIAAAVEEQTATTNEVARIVQESKKGVDGIAEVIKVVSNNAEESQTGANQTLTAAKGLSELAEQLKALVEKIQV